MSLVLSEHGGKVTCALRNLFLTDLAKFPHRVLYHDIRSSNPALQYYVECTDPLNRDDTNRWLPRYCIPYLGLFSCNINILVIYSMQDCKRSGQHCHNLAKTLQPQVQPFRFQMEALRNLPRPAPVITTCENKARCPFSTPPSTLWPRLRSAPLFLPGLYTSACL